jgi:hypothetical protein
MSESILFAPLVALALFIALVLGAGAPAPSAGAPPGETAAAIGLGEEVSPAQAWAGSARPAAPAGVAWS